MPNTGFEPSTFIKLVHFATASNFLLFRINNRSFKIKEVATYGISSYTISSILPLSNQITIEMGNIPRNLDSKLEMLNPFTARSIELDYRDASSQSKFLLRNVFSISTLNKARENFYLSFLSIYLLLNK